MAKNTKIQAVDNLTDNFRGYAAFASQNQATGTDCPATDNLCRQRRNASDVLGCWRNVTAKPRCRRLGKKTLQRLAVDLKNDYSEIKGFLYAICSA